MIINEDLGREKEIEDAKLQPYDGETTYGYDPNTETYYLGKSTQRYRVYRKARGSWCVGTTISTHFKCVRVTPPRDKQYNPRPLIDVDGKQVVHDEWAEKNDRCSVPGSREYNALKDWRGL